MRQPRAERRAIWRALSPAEREQLVLRRRAAQADRERALCAQPRFTPGKHLELYAGPVPAWDESLGDFMCFEGCC